MEGTYTKREGVRPLSLFRFWGRGIFRNPPSPIAFAFLPVYNIHKMWIIRWISMWIALNKLPERISTVKF